MSLQTRIEALAVAIRTKINAMVPRLLPSGGASGTVLAKSAGTDYATGWVALGTASARNIHVGTTAPSSPADGDLWVDIS